MRIGFETIGNATIVCHDGEPVLCTDAWITDDAYFGSWTHSHEIPAEQLADIRACRYAWFSHGHPDHLNPDSHPEFLGKQILLSDHVGQRIHHGLVEQGHQVRVLPEREWVQLSEHIRVLSIADFNQDSVLLIDINGRLLLNLNDANENNGWGGFVKRVARDFDRKILLALSGYGDADMINFHDEEGNFVEPVAAQRFPVGAEIQRRMRSLGANYFVPSSAMHRYQREDSIWANRYATELSDHAIGFEPSGDETLLPAYISYDCEDDSWTCIDPAPREERVLTAAEFGDDWAQPLETGDLEKLRAYIQPVEHLGTFLDYVNFRVGGQDNFVELQKRGFDRGITFEVPRNSLMNAVEWEIFDDLLIGNFMRTILHGSWPETQLYPDFSPYLAKYADNGFARSRSELEAYLRSYRKRAPLEFFVGRMTEHAHRVATRALPQGSALRSFAKRAYWYARRVA
jgi:hypothetical protein